MRTSPGTLDWNPAIPPSLKDKSRVPDRVRMHRVTYDRGAVPGLTYVVDCVLEIGKVRLCRHEAHGRRRSGEQVLVAHGPGPGIVDVALHGLIRYSLVDSFFER